MKVSEWLRQYQISGEVPQAPKGEEMIAFYAGWLIGAQTRTDETMEVKIAFAIKASEFIEEHAA